MYQLQLWRGHKTPYHEGSSYTADMINYHVFSKVNLETPTVIIETGFMNLDAGIVISQPELVARGIANGIMCFVQNQSLPSELMPHSATLSLNIPLFQFPRCQCGSGQETIHVNHRLIAIRAHKLSLFHRYCQTS